MGKSSIVYVVGLSLLVVLALLNLANVSNGSMKTYSDYYTRTASHTIASAGANIGTHLLLFDSTYNTDLTDQPFDGGFFDMRITRPPGGLVVVTSISRLDVGGESYTDTIIAVLTYTPFSKYAYFSEAERNGYLAPGSTAPPSGASMWKISGDSMFGYAHTNGSWDLGGTPYFRDKVTAGNGPNTMLVGGVYAPVFAGGYDWGITVTRPTANLTNLENMALTNTPPAEFDGQDVALTFFPDGTVNVQIPPETGSTRNDTVPISSITSNGILAVKNGDIRVKGTYHGQLTILALEGTVSGGTKGNIWIDGDIVAADDPRSNPSSDDMLGLVSERMTYVTTTGITRDASSQVNIEAAIYCQKGVFAAENYNSIPVSGHINAYGALTMAGSTSTGALGFSGSSYYLEHGFLKSIWHDPRYLGEAPPYFPVSDKRQLVSWWEN